MAETRSMPAGAVSALEAGEKRLAQPLYPFVGIRWAVVAFTIVCMVVGFGFALSDLLTAWHTGQSRDWSDFWNFGFSILGIISPVLLLTRKDLWETLGVGNAPERIRTACLAARSADDSVAPLALTQPAPLDNSGPSSGDSRALMLRRPRGTSRDMVGGCGWILIVCGALSLVIGIFILTISFIAPDRSGPRMSVVIFTLSGSALVASGWLLVRRGNAIASVIVQADELGIAWRSGTRCARWRRISWNQPLAFVTLSYRSTSTYQNRHLYALDTPAGVLSWEEYELPTWETHTGADRAVREDASYLCKLVVTRTGLPLRDISSALEPVKTVQPAKPALKLPLGPPGSLRNVPVDELFAEPAPPAPARPPCIVRAERLALASLGVLTLLLYGGGWGLQHYQQRSYAQMPIRVHQEQPLYSDALAFADGDWPEQKSSDADMTTAHFVDESYHLSSGKGYTAEVNGPGVYGDAAIEVTVRHYGQSDDPGAGLAIRADDGVYETMTFTVNAMDGTWAFWYYRYAGGTSDDWNVLQWDEPNDAIHRGEGAANTLLVVVRRGQYLCYINDHFVGIINDDSIRPPRGHAGIIVDDGTTTGVFTNFAVYPVPPPQFPF